MTPHIINFPRLHEELTPNPKPDDTVFLASLLFQGNTAPASASLAEAMQSALPLPLEKAQRKAKELQEFGADLWDSKQLETLAAISHSKTAKEQEHFSELLEIKNFIASQGQTHGEPKTSETAATIENVRIGKELTLCIAYELEQAIIDTQTAIKKLGMADAAFLASLHTGGQQGNGLRDEGLQDDGLHDNGLKDILATVPSLSAFTTSPDINLPYCTVLEAILPFLPEEIMLFTNDEAVLETLQETGVLTTGSTEPLPGQEQFRLVHVPAWKLLRRKKADSALPWTARTLGVCFPETAKP